MKLTTEFKRDLDKVNGDGTRQAKFQFLAPARSAAKALSTPDVARNFGDILSQYDRPTVGICVAATVVSRRNRLSRNLVAWADEVLSHYTNRPSNLDDLVIRDNLHPTKVEQYTALFVNSTIAD